MRLFATTAILIFANFGCFAQAQSPEAKQISAKLICDAWTGNREKNPAFQIDVPFTLTDAALTGERVTSSSGNKEVFKGLIADSGDILLIGRGSSTNGLSKWAWEFHGKYNPKGTSTLKGGMKNTSGGVGSRKCEITF
ncbi:hypothetical protein [Bradyrhizobium sp. NAS80.1]|uniref:hypothetical protein n=1 Tax=Bradyrhizobium sp. NAS80.1 TaxID=1680159 RepID=UPI001160F2F8|nr:hypothetical protein [Bradyrhizobium sp. NAS80.1]